MKAPRTYTREQMAEVYSHGGPAVLKAILALMMRQGARLAEPGEFTKRAFLNGRIDLAQAESVLDIIRERKRKRAGVRPCPRAGPAVQRASTRQSRRS